MDSGCCSTNQDEAKEVLKEQCGVCSGDDENTAIGYCKQCNQYLCTRCCDSHRKITGVKHHRITGKDGTTVGPDTLFGRNLTPRYVASVPPIPSVANNKHPAVRSVHCVDGSDKMIVSCWFAESNIHVISEMMNNDHERWAVGFGQINALCLQSDNTILISVKGNKAVSEIDISQPCYKRKDVFAISGDECLALKEFDDGYAAAITIATDFNVPNWQIQLLSRDGTVKNRLAYDKDGNAFFGNVVDIASNNSGNALFVVDDDKNTLMAFTIAGEIIFSLALQSPKSLAVDKDGNIYVACREKVYLVNEGGTNHVVAFSCTNAKPEIRIAFDFSKELVVVADGGNKLHYFTFT